jgi:hypothetical protein
MELVNDIEKQAEETAGTYRLSMENVLQVGFNLFRKAPAEFIVLSVLGVLVFSNPISGILLGGPFMASYLHLAHLARGNKRMEFADLFMGFNKARNLILLNLLIFSIVFLGLLLLILPGIYFAVCYVFSHFFVWFYDRDPYQAIALSRKVVNRNFGQILLLLLILSGINLLGFMALGIGILLTMPYSFCVLYAAFDDIIGIKN